MKANFTNGDRTSLCVRSAEDGQAFALIELAVVIGVIALLAATLLPALASTKFRDRVAMCTANCRQWGAAMLRYSSDHDSYFPNEPLPGTAGGEPWDVADRFITDMAAYGLNHPKTWFCPVRSWAYAQDDAVCRKDLGHPLTTVTNDVAFLFAYNGVWPNPDFEGLAGGNNYGGLMVAGAGYEPWVKRYAGGVLYPSAYTLSGNPNPRSNMGLPWPGDWLSKPSDPHAAQIPILTDIAIGNGNNPVYLNSVGLKAVFPGQGHPAGASPNGQIQSDDLVFGDGHVETHGASEIVWRYTAAVPYAAFY